MILNNDDAWRRKHDSTITNEENDLKIPKCAESFVLLVTVMTGGSVFLNAYFL